ncbi:MAG: TolC family protein [Gammaproteobacteria bacterium]|nr:TolC family protein [Gammaproteobacteria bacterium]MCW9004390.1 TolC family protein [Gammaproteobacteria bacterium]
MTRLKYIITFLLFSPGLFAEQASHVLPDPLTLEYVLSLANDVSHYDILQADAALEQAVSKLQKAESAYALEADLSIEGRWIEPSPLAVDQSNNDHRAILSVKKPIYDFGQTANNIAAAELDRQSAEDNLAYWVKQRRINIAKAFFEVLVADYKERWDNEQVVITYVNHEAEKDRYALGEISDVELLKIKNQLELLQSLRANSRSQQRVTRAQLAEVINRPGELSSNLKLPDLNYHKRKLPAYESLVNRLEELNQPLKLLIASVEAAEKRVRAAQMQDRPSLSAEIIFSEYERESASNNDWAAGLKLTVPLLEHQGMQAAISQARSQWLNRRAMLLKAQSNARNNLLSLCQKISLLMIQRDQLKTEMEYHELELDKNRVLYEMEVATNFGDAMVAISDTRYKQVKTDFELALAWMNLEIMFNNQISFDGSDNE